MKYKIEFIDGAVILNDDGHKKAFTSLDAIQGKIKEDWEKVSQNHAFNNALDEVKRNLNSEMFGLKAWLPNDRPPIDSPSGT